MATSRIASTVGSIVFLFVAPGVMGVLIPWGLTGRRLGPPLLGVEALRWLGVPLIILGGVLLLDSFARFAWQGRGTPAPIYPTATLVVSGAYRFVRNPMYVAVTALIAGQALVFGSVTALIYALVFMGITHVFVLAYEEPTLRQSYGAQYETYARHVHRWLPRLTPWHGGADQAAADRLSP